MCFKGNVDNVMAEARRIAERLKDTDVTLSALMKEYHCGWAIINRAILSQMSKSQWKRIRKKKLVEGSLKGGGRFKPGNIPWDKGKKGIHPSPATEFKKGHLPAQHRHVGSIRIVKREREGRINTSREIKVSGIMQGRHKWVPYARNLYEQKYGTVPKGHFVVHVDGDSMNDDLDNLRMVDRKGHLDLLMQRDPKMLKKCRRNAAKALRKRWAAHRRRKAKHLKISRKTCEPAHRVERKESHKTLFEKGIINIRDAFVEWWECKGCGFEAVNNPPLPCPKCGGLNYEKIRQKRMDKPAVERELLGVMV